MFQANFKKFEAHVAPDVLQAAPAWPKPPNKPGFYRKNKPWRATPLVFYIYITSAYHPA